LNPDSFLKAMFRAIQTTVEATVSSLANLPIGAPARVIAVSGTGAIARRLMEMGVVPGAQVRVIKAAPLGDPIEVRVRGYHLALRRTEAQTITVSAGQ
jgi:ferrous iron transport protein A